MEESADPAARVERPDGPSPRWIDTELRAGDERFSLYLAARGERGHYPFLAGAASVPLAAVSPFRLPPEIERTLWVREPFPAVLPGTLLPPRLSR